MMEPRDHLSRRAKWQNNSTSAGAGAEEVAKATLEVYLMNDPAVEYIDKPSDLKGIYGYGTWKDRKGMTRKRLYGIEPDFGLRNRETGRTIFGEMKRQKPGNGNAHERACKYFAPGIVAATQKIGRWKPSVWPFWLIFAEGLASDPRSAREIAHWFDGTWAEKQYTFWPSTRDNTPVLKHFDEHIRPLLMQEHLPL